MKLTGVFAAAFALFALGGLTAAEHRLDLRGSAARPKLMQAQASAAAVPEAGVLRQTRLASGAAALPPLAVGDALSLELFDDVERTVVLKKRLESSLGGEAFLATVEGGDGLVSTAVVQTENGVQIDLRDIGKGRVYTVASSAETTLVRELDPRAGTVTPCRTRVPELSPCAVEIAAPGRMMSAPTVEQSSTVVDILVAYDTAAAAWAKANGGGIANFALLAVTKMNAALANNGLDEQFRFRLVGTMEVAATSTDVEDALDEIKAGKAGWSAIPAKRDEVGADIVTVLIDTGYAFGTTGVGWSLMTTDLASFADSAYNVCAVRAVAIDHTMTHEVGHNMGAGHASAVNPATIVPGPQLYDYSSGFHFTAGETAYHTIMAYDSDGWGNTYELAPLFSSQTATWLGAAAGDATHDNARTLRNTYAAAANWRDQKVPLSYDVFFSPEAEMFFDESVEVTLTPGKAGLDIRYTTDGIEPTLTSQHYSTPLKLTRTTTVKAAAVYDGRLGPIFTARYLKRDLATALNAPQFEWTTSPDSPWVAQTDIAFDGFAAQSCPEFVGDVGCRKTSWLKATVVGPTEMGFRYQKRLYASEFRVSCDDQVVWSDSETESGIGAAVWHQAMVSLPEGSHEIMFAFEQGNGYYRGVFNGVVLDTVCFDTWSASPAIEPATTDDQATARVFTGSMTVTLTPPAGRTGTLLYTLDGSDPTLGGALTYTGPITVDKSVFVQAVFVEPGREASAPVKGYYLERHPVRPGEWTTDVEGVKEAASQDGRLIAVLMAHRADCGWTKRLMPVAESPEFLAWAEANGVYLITADSSQLVDTKAATDYFWSLYPYTSVSYPTLAFADPSDPDELLEWGVARNSKDSTVGGVPFVDTVESLVRGFLAVMGEKMVMSAPLVSPETELVDSFPLTVTLTNPNLTGTIYYTLDGSTPTPRNGTQYAGAVAIKVPGVTLKAAVWEKGGLSGPMAVKSYQTIADVLGTTGVTWADGSSVKWRKDQEPGVLCIGGLQDSTYASTLSATVSGKGRLVFTYQFNSWTWQNTFDFSINGNSQFRKCYDGNYSFSDTVTQDVETDGETTFTWTYTVADSTRDYGAGYASQAGVWLSDVQWIPERKVTPNGVAYAWLDEKFPTVGARTPEQYAALENEDADGDGYLNWQEYLCGTDPHMAGAGADAVPRCTIEIVNGVPEVDHNIRIPDAAQIEGWRAVLKGSVDLRNWSEANMSVHHFFKAVVEKN